MIGEDFLSSFIGVKESRGTKFCDIIDDITKSIFFPIFFKLIFRTYNFNLLCLEVPAAELSSQVVTIGQVLILQVLECTCDTHACAHAHMAIGAPWY